MLSRDYKEQFFTRARNKFPNKNEYFEDGYVEKKI